MPKLSASAYVPSLFLLARPFGAGLTLPLISRLSSTTVLKSLGLRPRAGGRSEGVRDSLGDIVPGVLGILSGWKKPANCSSLTEPRDDCGVSRDGRRLVPGAGPSRSSASFTSANSVLGANGVSPSLVVCEGGEYRCCSCLSVVCFIRNASCRSA